jgi:hypothetical protein
MRSKQERWVVIVYVAIGIALTMIASSPAAAQQEQVIYSFSGSNPTGGVTFDTAGNLYGAQALQIYQLAPQAGGGWTEKVIYNFDDSEDAEGTFAWDSAGNLYGVTLGGPVTTETSSR